MGSRLVSAGPDISTAPASPTSQNHTTYITTTTHLRRRLTKLNPSKSTPMIEFVTSERLLGKTFTEQRSSHDAMRPIPSQFGLILSDYDPERHMPS